MAREFLTEINLRGNRLTNALLTVESASTATAPYPEVGRIIIDNGVLKYHDGNMWVAAGTGSGGAGSTGTGYAFEWKSNTAATDPLHGYIKSNSMPNTTLATQIYASVYDKNGQAVLGLLDLNTGSDILLYKAGQGSAWNRYVLTGPPVKHGSPVEWVTLTVTFVESGVLPFMPSDLSPVVLTVLAAGTPGPAGPAGPTGSQGAVGPTGATGAPGTPGATGATGAPGAQGPVGTTGATGAPGPTGAAGSTGATGAKGDPGQPGATGAPGAPGQVGPTGPAGATGAKGDTGEVGPAGLTFRGEWVPRPAIYEENDLVTYEGSGYYCAARVSSTVPPPTDTTHWALLVLEGAPGPEGPTGAPGATGATGAPGASGPTGATGAPGAQGPAGTTGATGATGPVGSIGPAGATGATGSQGPIGPTGATGSTGPAGATGVAGPTGAAGPPGGGTLAGTITPAINSAQTTFTARLSNEWPTGSIDQRVLADSELMQIVTAVLVSGQDYMLTVQRAILGTTAATHVNNTIMYLRPPALSTTLPVATTVAKVGTSQQAARADHDHGITGGTGGGSSTLAGLTDVTVQSPATGHGLYFDAPTGTWRNLPPIVGPQGPQGVKGDPGTAGPTGATGAPGATGVQGPVGSTGATGPQGSPGVKGDPGSQGVPGSTGPVGPTGATGPQGNSGPQGVPGSAGAVGPLGPIGPAGPIGSPGPVGPVGPVGQAGPAGPVGPGVPTGGVTGQVLVKTSDANYAVGWGTAAGAIDDVPDVYDDNYSDLYDDLNDIFDDAYNDAYGSVATGGGGGGTTTPTGQYFAVGVGDGANGGAPGVAPVITHSLNTRDLVVEVYRATTPWDTVHCTVERTTLNTTTLRFAAAVTANAYRVIMRGM